MAGTGARSRRQHVPVAADDELTPGAFAATWRTPSGVSSEHHAENAVSWEQAAMMSRGLRTSGTAYDSTSRRMRLAVPLAGARGCSSLHRTALVIGALVGATALVITVAAQVPVGSLTLKVRRLLALARSRRLRVRPGLSKSGLPRQFRASLTGIQARRRSACEPACIS